MLIRRADRVERASHTGPATVEDVGVDHGRAHVVVAEQFLHGPDIVAVFQ